MPGVVAHRPGPPLGVDLGASTRLADPQPAVERAAMDDQRRPTGRWVSATVKTTEPSAEREDRPGRRPGRRPRRRTASGRGRPRPRRRLVRRSASPRRQLVVLDPVAEDRHDRALGGRRLVAEERRVADPADDRLVEGGQLGVAGQLGLAAAVRLRSRCSARAASKPARSTPTPYSAASSTSGRSGSRTCRGAGRRRRRGRTGASAGSSSGRRPTTRSAAVSGMSASSSWPVPASSVRANWASSRSIAVEDLRSRARAGTGRRRP